MFKTKSILKISYLATLFLLLPNSLTSHQGITISWMNEVEVRKLKSYSHFHSALLQLYNHKFFSRSPTNKNEPFNVFCIIEKNIWHLAYPNKEVNFFGFIRLLFNPKSMNEMNIICCWHQRQFNDQLIRGYKYVRRMEEAHNLGSDSGFNYPV